jgi:hypothetical protein
MNKKTVAAGLVLGFLVLAVGPTKVVGAPARIDLAEAVIFNYSSGKVQAKAALMLRDEIAKRTRIRLDIVSRMPDEQRVAIMIGTVQNLPKVSLPTGLEVPDKAEGYARFTFWGAMSGALCMRQADCCGSLQWAGTGWSLTPT